MVPKQYTPEYFPNWTQVPFCFNDLNSLSHVNNTLFDSYFEKVRIQFLQKIPELLEDLERKRFIVLRKSTNEYLAPILYCNTLFNYGSVHRVHVSPESISCKSCAIPILINCVRQMKPLELGLICKYSCLLISHHLRCFPTIYYLPLLIK